MKWLLNLLRGFRRRDYLVLQTHYEGIERVRGVFTRSKAIEVALEQKRRARLRQEADKAYDEAWQRACDRHSGPDPEKAYEAVKADPELVAADAARDHVVEEVGWQASSDPDWVCVVEVTPEDTRCVCAELGVKPSKPMLRG